LKGNFIGNSSSTVMRRAAVEEVGGWDATLRARDAEGCEDQALYISLAKKWNYTFAPHYLIAYRIHPWSMSQDVERMARSQALVLVDLHRLRPRVPGYWLGRGIARIYEGPLTTALLQKQWNKVAEVIKCAASISWWSVVQLLCIRMPIRTFGFCSRRLRKSITSGEREERSVGTGWPTEDDAPASSEFFPDTPSLRHPHRSRV
jgi:hypothetical protein